MNYSSLNGKRRILVIDDNDAIHADFRKILGVGDRRPDLAGDEEAIFGQSAPALPQMDFEIESASQGKEGYDKVAAAVAAGNPFHVAFVDMRMPPGWDGVQTIRALWAIDPNLQVVICTAFSDYSWEQIIQQLGSTDRMLILKKPFDELEVCQLATALTAKWMVTAQAKLKQAELELMVQARTAELKHAALVDKLTGLPNRELLHDRLGQLLQQSRRDPQRKFALLFLDFDRFKVVNDSLGHEVGDLLLIGIAERLRKETRGSDTVALQATAARLGGDEFIVVLDDLSEHHDAVRVAERLLEALSVPYTLKGRVVHSTASIGITTSAVAYHNPDDMIRDADTAMYRAKAAGKARYVVFDQQMHEDAVSRLTLEHDLRAGIEAGQFILHYQPVVAVATGAPVAFEALVRWMHPRHGLVPPLDFIPLAEEIGAIVPLGYWVLGEACRQIAEWRRRRPEFARIGVCVNLSRKQLAAPDLLERIERTLAEAGLSPGDLTLEITESAVMSDPNSAIRVLQHVRQLGVHLYIDDFGTGYSSLSCLHSFPITGLKIDRAFVNTVAERRDYAAVVNAIVSLAHNLGIQLVAEGVETADQHRMLMSMGCDQAQGYYFARPMDADAAEQFLLNARPPLLAAAVA